MSFEICHMLCSALTIKLCWIKWMTPVFLGSPFTVTKVFVTLIAIFCFLAFKASLTRCGGVLSYPKPCVLKYPGCSHIICFPHKSWPGKERLFSPQSISEQVLSNTNICSLDIKANLSAAHPDSCYVPWPWQFIKASLSVSKLMLCRVNPRPWRFFPLQEKAYDKGCSN